MQSQPLLGILNSPNPKLGSQACSAIRDELWSRPSRGQGREPIVPWEKTKEILHRKSAWDPAGSIAEDSYRSCLQGTAGIPSELLL